MTNIKKNKKRGKYMNDEYIEHMIKKRMTPLSWILRIASILFTLLCILMFNVFGLLALLVGIGAAYLVRYTFQSTNIEYEYIYFGGECQIDKIMAKSKRKGCGKIEVEKLEMMAPEGDDSLTEFERQNYRMRNFTSGDKDAKRYVAFERKDSELIKVVFEPNIELVKAMQARAPRKVIV